VPPLFPVGTECQIAVNGDEIRLLPGLGKSGIVAPKSVVLLFDDAAYGASGFNNGDAVRVQSAYIQSANAGDRDGVERLISDGDAVRVDIGTKCLVVSLRNAQVEYLRLPSDDRGARFVRLLDGPNKGKVVGIPARNLRPIADEDQNQKRNQKAKGKA
jgi:hypothetical protein